MLPNSLHPTTMSKPPQDLILPPAGSTQESADFHLEAANRERAAIGLPPQARLHLVSVSPIGPRLVSRKQTTELQDAIDTLVETYGLAAVKRAVQLVEAANGGKG